MTKIFAVDPGTFESAYVYWGGDLEIVLDMGKVPNEELLALPVARSRTTGRGIKIRPDVIAIEDIRSYGNAMGQSTIDTAVWIGRFQQAFCQNWLGLPHRVPRMEVKKHICKNHQAKDSNVIQALVDRFAYDQPNKGKGTKKEPGFFYGFKKDIWQAMALAVTVYDQGIGRQNREAQ